MKIINEDIKQKDFLFISEREERSFEEALREKDRKKYLEYISIKLLLLYSLKTDIFLENSLFKYIKGEGETYYLTDIQVYRKSPANVVWGDIKGMQENQ